MHKYLIEEKHFKKKNVMKYVIKNVIKNKHLDLAYFTWGTSAVCHHSDRWHSQLDTIRTQDNRAACVANSAIFPALFLNSMENAESWKRDPFGQA